MPYNYIPLYQTNHEGVELEKISSDFVQVSDVDGKKILQLDPRALTFLAQRAFHEISFFYRKSHLENLRRVIDDPEASPNDRYIAQKLIENAVESAKGLLPGCQDTGTAIVIGHKGEKVWTDAEDAAYLSRGIFETYVTDNLRYSQLAPLNMFEERNTKNNLPAQINLYAEKGAEYHFLFIAKGGGSANKTRLYPMTKSLLNEASLHQFLLEEIRKIGTTACPPYYLTVVIGGTSAEENLKIVKLASTEYLDSLPTRGDETGRAYRDLEWEAKVMEIAQKIGVGAQFGGKYFAHRAIVVRLPRHGASCPVGLGVSCSAHRNILAKITAEGLFLEKLEKNPARYLPKVTAAFIDMVPFDLKRPMDVLLKEIAPYPAGTKFLFSGEIIVARDIAHARIAQMLRDGQAMPEYCKKYPIYYAGPAKTPKGMPTGSFGPTTSNRMDPYLDSFNALGAAMITIGKGERSPAAIESFRKYGSFYFGSIGGAAAILARESIWHTEVVDFEDLGMEAVRKIKVKNFPAMLIYDRDGKSFY